MYEQFYGIREKPFSLTPDTDYFYRYSGHQQAINVMLVALRNGEGFVRITGEVGTGKTLLCRKMLSLLSEDCETVYVPNPLLSPLELYQSIARELRLEISSERSVQQLTQDIFIELVRLKKEQRPVVILIDEAQAMPHRSLEAIRLLSNLETEKEKLLHIFFFAQPEFEQRLQQHNLRQLRQRITFSYQLPTLNKKEMLSYLAYRMEIAGHQGNVPFKASAVDLMYKASRGVPRVINLLAHKALLVGFGKGKHHIDRAMIKTAILDTPGLSTPRFGPGRFHLLEFSMVLLVAMTTLVVWRLLL